MEQMKKEVIEMVEKICSNEKALGFVHGFLKAFIERYLQECAYGLQSRNYQTN